MIYNSKGFIYDGQSSGGFIGSDSKPIRILNVVLNNDMYSQPITGSRSIKEVKIPGRSRPYLYEVDESPMEFDIAIAFEEPILVTDARKIARWLLTPRTYRALEFESDSSKVFYAMFVSQPMFTYINAGSNSLTEKTISIYHDGVTDTTLILHDAVSATALTSQTYNQSTNVFRILAAAVSGTYEITYEVPTEKLVGYMELHARCNAPTAFSKNTTTGFVDANTSQTIVLNVDGDQYTEPDIEILVPSVLPAMTGGNLYGLVIKNNTNNSWIGFNNLVVGEKISVVASLKTVTSDKQSTRAIYPRWTRTDLTLEIDANNIELVFYSGEITTDQNGNPSGNIITGVSNIQYKLTYEAPRFL